jgi:hypothetical protein
MKDQVLPKVDRAGGMRDVEFVYVDVDHEPALAKRLLQGGSIPQLVRFDRTQDGWKPSYLIGAHQPERVSAFLSVESDKPKMRYSSYHHQPQGP